jgi:hypothetical protein
MRPSLHPASAEKVEIRGLNPANVFILVKHNMGQLMWEGTILVTEDEVDGALTNLRNCRGLGGIRNGSAN